MWNMGRTVAALFLGLSLLLLLRHHSGQTNKDLTGILTEKIQTTAEKKNKDQFFLLEAQPPRLLEAEPPSPANTLEIDFYRDKCPQAELIIRLTVARFHFQQPNTAPTLLRLAFHDCFIQGCDASVLLNGINGTKSEKETAPNQTLKGFDVIDAIKSELEQACPATVSCADIIVLAAQASVVLVGGPFYPVLTGRRDSSNSFHDLAATQLPTPNDDLTTTLSKFSRRGFTLRETVSLFGAHSIGSVSCKFVANRLYNFSSTGTPDATLDPNFLTELKQICANATGIALGDAGGFGNGFFKRVVAGRGVLHSDQQLMAGELTAGIVMEYASDGGGLFAFRSDFARAMVKMSGLGVLVAPRGQIRRNCSVVVG